MKPVPGKFWLFWINWSRASGDRSISAAFQPIYTAATRSLAALEILVRSQLNPTLSKSASEFRIRLPVRGQRCQADYIN